MRFIETRTPSNISKNIFLNPHPSENVTQFLHSDFGSFLKKVLLRTYEDVLQYCVKTMCGRLSVSVYCC